MGIIIAVFSLAFMTALVGGIMDIENRRKKDMANLRAINRGTEKRIDDQLELVIENNNEINRMLARSLP